MGVGSIFPKVLFTPTKPEGMITRAVEFTREKNNPISSLSKDGLPVNMDVAVLYRGDGKKAPELLREYGPDYEEKLIKQIVSTSVRDAIAEIESSVVYQDGKYGMWMMVYVPLPPIG